MAPSVAAFVHLPAQELHPDCLQLPHRGGEIVDQEADHGTGGEVLVVLVAQGRTPRRCLLGELEGGEVGLLLAGGQADDRLEKCPQGPGTRFVLVPTQPMHLTRILVAPPLRSLASAILPRRSWLS